MNGKKRIVSEVVMRDCSPAKLEAVPKASRAVDFEHPTMQTFVTTRHKANIYEDGYRNVSPMQRSYRLRTIDLFCS